MMIRRPASLIVLVLVVLGATTAPAAPKPPDATPVVVSGPLAQFWGYATPMLVVEKGGELTYANIDVVKHDVVHDVESDGFGTKKKMPWCKEPKSDGHGHHHEHGTACPVFWSDQIGAGETTEVLGLENLKPGTIYTFFCTLHHGMKGTLIAR